MKISKRSWHYRFMKFATDKSDLVDGELPQMSLCKYVACLIFLLIWGPIFWSAALVIIIVLSPFLIGAALLCAWEDYRAKHPCPPREPFWSRTLIGKWLKAKKDKACPLIEWED